MQICYKLNSCWHPSLLRYWRKKLKKQIKYILEKIKLFESDKNIKEYWIVFYVYEGEDFSIEQIRFDNFYNDVIKDELPETLLKFKKFAINKNVIDKDNRVIYQNFMRSEIDNIEDIFVHTPETHATAKKQLLPTQ